MKTLESSAGSAVLIVAASALMLASCGGGGDDQAGAPVAFSVVPTSSGFTAPAGSPTGQCFSGGSSTVFIYGGAAPYHIDNTVPQYLTVDRTTVDDRGGSFNVTVTGPGCLTAGSIVVVDRLNNKVTFTVDNKPASATGG